MAVDAEISLARRTASWAMTLPSQPASLRRCRAIQSLLVACGGAQSLFHKLFSAPSARVLALVRVRRFVANRAALPTDRRQLNSPGALKTAPGAAMVARR